MSKVAPISTRSTLDTPVSVKASVQVHQISAPITEDEMKKSRSTMVILDHPEVTSVPPVRSVSLVNDMRNIGMLISEVPYVVYPNPKSVGMPLKFDPDGEMKGYENLYDTVDEFEKTFSAVQKLGRRLHDKAQSILSTIDEKVKDENLSLEQKVALAEAPDAEALGTIRTKALGWFLDPPVAMDIKLTPPSMKWANTLDVVARRYAEALKNGSNVTSAGDPLPAKVDLSMSDYDLRDLDSDPSDTLTGLPLLASGEETIPTRVAMLAAAPAMTGISGSKWIDAYATNLSKACGITKELVLGATIANRTSSFRKPRRVWVSAPGGYTSSLEVRGLGARVRNVFPIPFPLNYAMAPCYKQMSTARMKIEGLWHSPRDWERMLTKLMKPGLVVVSADYSGMDTRISPSVVQVIAESLMKHGFSRFSCEVLANIQKVMSVFTPSYAGTPGHTTKMSGVIPWLSGYKLTSEIDTIYGVATTLAALAEQPRMDDVVQRWANGSFILYELGDDTIFTLTKEENDAIDWAKFTEDSKRMVGASVKKDVAPVFLKKIVLSPKSSPRMLARVFQQTFFNENRNDGLPPIVSLIGLKARIEGLSQHPWFNDFYPEFIEIVLRLKFARELNLKEVIPDTPLSADHNRLLVEYAASLSGRDWLAELEEQAKYSKAALDSLALIKRALGSGYDLMTRDRKMYREASLRDPTPDELKLLYKARTKFFR